MLEKMAMQLNESNRLYSTINGFNNALPGLFDKMAAGYSVSNATTSLSHLSATQKGELLTAATSFYLAIAKEILGASVYSNLRSVGYKDPVFDAVIADVATYYTGEAYIAISTNFVKTKELFDTCLAQFSGYISPTQNSYTDAAIIELLEKIIIVKNKLAEVAPFFNKVG